MLRFCRVTLDPTLHLTPCKEEIVKTIPKREGFSIVLKLILVAILCSVTWALPRTVYGQDLQQYTCNWTDFNQCYQDNMAWMNQCTYGCSYGKIGSDGQVCWQDVIHGSVCDAFGQNCKPIISYYTDCMSVPSGAQSCDSQCASMYQQNLNNCVATYCTPL